MEEKKTTRYRAMAVAYFATREERDALMAWLDRHGLSWNAASKEQVERELKRLDRLTVKQEEVPSE